MPSAIPFVNGHGHAPPHASPPPPGSGPAAALAPRPAAAADVLASRSPRPRCPTGSTVILHEDHALPLVVVNIAGTRSARASRSRSAPASRTSSSTSCSWAPRARPTKMFDAWMEAAGGWNNAWTSEDRTDYYDVGPPTRCRSCSGSRPIASSTSAREMTLEKLDAQRDVVRNERRQTSENTPYGKVELRLPELLYPEGHPYHHPVIGSHEDLAGGDGRRREGVLRDAGTCPNNASLVVAGDFDPGDGARRRSSGSSAGIPPRRACRAEPPGFATPTTLTGVVRETIPDNVELAEDRDGLAQPRALRAGRRRARPRSPTSSRDGKASRLYKALVYDKKLAQEVDGRAALAGLSARLHDRGDRRSRASRSTSSRPPSTPRSASSSQRAGHRRGAHAREEPVRDELRARASSRCAARAALLNMYQPSVGDPGYAEKDLAALPRRDAGVAARHGEGDARPRTRASSCASSRRSSPPPKPAPPRRREAK